MRPLRSLLIYLAVVFVGAALLAPWLFWLAQSAAEQFPFCAPLARVPFHRFVNRALLGLALIGLWPLVRSLGVRSWTDVGLARLDRRRLAAGFAFGFGSLAVVAALAVLVGARQFNPDLAAAKLFSAFTKAALAAAIVSVVEELLFRGALFGTLKRAHHWHFALGASSAVYALVHFFQKAVPSSPITWRSGLETLAKMLRGFVELEALVPGFFTLTLAGSILALAYHRSGSLWFSIGLHAGWIFWLKSYNAMTVATAGANLWLWGSGKMIDGWLAMAVLTAVLLAVRWWFRREPPPHHAGQPA